MTGDEPARGADRSAPTGPTAPGSAAAPGSAPAPSPAGSVPDARAEQVLSQALRLMAGGRPGAEQGSGTAPSPRQRLTTGQLLLLAAVVGLVIGIVAGLLSLL